MPGVGRLVQKIPNSVYASLVTIAAVWFQKKAQSSPLQPLLIMCFTQKDRILLIVHIGLKLFPYQLIKKQLLCFTFWTKDQLLIFLSSYAMHVNKLSSIKIVYNLLYEIISFPLFSDIIINLPKVIKLIYPETQFIFIMSVPQKDR